MSRTLVTGASGFIGVHLVRALLDRGHRVACLVRHGSAVEPLEAAGARLCVGDVNNADSLSSAIAGQDVVFHLAGRTRALSASEFLAVNENGARAVATACAGQSNPPVLVHVSSLAAAGPSAWGRLHAEADPPAPVSHYGRSKRAGELAVAALAHRLPITVVRPPIVIGPGDRLGLPLFASVARLGVQALPTLSQSQFSVVHVADLVELLIAAAERGERLSGPAPAAAESPTSNEPPAPSAAPAHGNGMAVGQGVYYAAAEQTPTLAELGQMIALAAGRRRAIVLPLPSPLTWSVAAIMELLAHLSRHPASLNLDKAREATAGCWTCSAEKAALQLGFAPAASLEERVAQTVQWYRDSGWL